MTLDLKWLCCAAAGLGIVAVLALLLVWALCHVAALDRETNGNEQTH